MPASITEKSIPRAACPEAAGISSKAVLAMLDKFEENNAEVHSVMVIRHGKVAAECYRYPFNAQTTHCMYSVSKGITGTALGFAVTEGKLSLDDRLVDFFPEKRPKKNEPSFDDITIRRLVTMTAGKTPKYTLNKSKGDWFAHFSNSKKVAEPGKEFNYVNENPYVICAVLQKVLGMSVNEYLTPRLWAPLGIKTPFWETDKNGIEAGGWGLQLRLEDMAKVVYCYANKGKFGGIQIIPEEWARQAVLNQKPTADGGEANFQNGYGYGIWRNNEREWRFDGMYCQIGIYDEIDDLLVVTNSGETFAGRVYEGINVLREGLIDVQPNALPDPDFQKNLAERKLDTVPVTGLRSPIEKSLNGKTIRFSKNAVSELTGFPMSVLPMTMQFMSKDRAGSINNVKMRFDDEKCTFSWDENGASNTVLCGRDGKYLQSDIFLAQMPFTALGTMLWRDEKTLEIWIRPMQTTSRRNLVFSFDNNRVTMTPSSSPPFSNNVSGIRSMGKSIMKGKAAHKLIDIVLDAAEKKLEPVHKGKII